MKHSKSEDLNNDAQKEATVEIPDESFASGIDLGELIYRYKDYKVDQIGYGTVSDYCDSMDHIRYLTDIHKDLKDVQRPWMLKAILSLLPVGSKILEIGAGEPFIADVLSKLGYDVYIVDPYDGTGNGPVEYEHYVKTYPDITIIRKFFTCDMSEFGEHEFDCIYSVSVLEHIPDDGFELFFEAVRKYTKGEGYTIHAIDHLHNGRGCEKSLEKMKCICNAMNLDEESLVKTLEKSNIDPDTYYLSPFGYYLWRGSMSCEDYPMRRIMTLNLCGGSCAV